MDTQAKQNIPVTTGKDSSGVALSTLRQVTDIERIFERTLDRFFGRHLPYFSLPGDLFKDMEARLPSLDVIDRDNEVLVRAEIPGIDKKNIDISLTDNLLTIKGQSSSEKKEEKGNYHRQEISRSSFARSVTLPGAVNSSKANATLKDGVLEITLPKLESSKRRSISVK